MFSRSNIYKYLAFSFILSSLFGTIIYFNLTNRHQAIIKSFVFEKLGISDKEWKINHKKETYVMTSPQFLIDGIYKSMEGPKSSNYIQLTNDSSLVWVTGFHVKAINNKSLQKISNDFVCHTNIDFNDAHYYGSFNLNDRIGKQYPRMTSLSHGLENFSFPKGYGIPMKGNEYLYVTTEALNHNFPKANFWLRHRISIDYNHDKKTKPLLSKTAFIMLPYNKYNPYKSPLDPGKNQCIPVETKNHSYDDGKGNMLSGHWVIPTGKNTYSSSINQQLSIKDSLRLHAAAIHVHPFATKISLIDKTSDKCIFTCKITNHKKGIGIDKMESFSSEKGVWLYASHDYEIELEVNNTSNTEQDMMGSMFLFFYDRELDEILNKKLIN